MQSTPHPIQTKRFAIQRDFSNGLLTQWEEEFPQGLEEYGVTEEQFKNTIQNLNRLFLETEHYSCFSCFEAAIACFSFYTYYLCFSGQYSRVRNSIHFTIVNRTKINFFLCAGQTKNRIIH